MDEAGVGDNKPLIVDELPTENISTRRSYLIRVSDDPEDGYQEWKYIEQADGTYKWEMLGVTKDYSYSKEDIDTFIRTLQGEINNINTELTWIDWVTPEPEEDNENNEEEEVVG